MDHPARAVPDGPLLIGIDETELSRDAIALGQQLALCVPGEPMYVYVHTFEELGALMTGRDPSEVEELVATHAQDKLERVRALAAEMGVSDVQLRQATSASEGLHEQALEDEAALLVIGSSSRSGLGRVLPGGTAERLLSGAPAPVAVAPNAYAGREPGQMVIGVGFDKSPEARQAVWWAADLATRSGAALQVLAVHAPMAFGNVTAGGTFGKLTVNQALVNELKSESEQLSEALPAELEVDTHVFEGDPALLLVGRSQELGLLVLGSRRYGPLKSVLLGSVSSHVSRNAYCPVLVVPRGVGGEKPW